MKKFLSFILILAMILSVSGVALAEGACGTTGCSTTHVAAIGTAQYHSLQDAIDAAKDGETITLLADCAENVTVTQQANVVITIDGADKTMTGSITVNGKSAAYATAGLTIQNVKFDASGISKDASINLGVKGDNNTRYVSNLTVEDCTFTDASEAKTKVAIKTYTGGDKNLTVKNCEATGLHSLMQLKNVAGVTIEGCEVTNSGRGIALGNSTNATIDNCKISVDSYGIRGDASSDNGGMTISKTEITADQPIVVRKTGDGGYTVAVGEGNTMTPGGDNDWCTVYSDDEKTKVDKDKLPENVIIPAATSAVAKIGDKPYDSLAAAVAAAEDGNTITLLDDCSGNGIVFPQDKFGTGLTIDFAGHTYTVDAAPLAGSSGTETQAFQILRDNKVTLKDGILTSTADSGVKMLVQNYSNLTLENMKLDGTNIGGGNYTLSNNYGTIVINNTEIIAPTDGVAFDVYDYAAGGYKPAPNVTVEGDNTKVTGKIEVSPAASLQISGGTFSEDPSAYLAEKCVVSKNANGKYVTTGAIPAAIDDDGNAKATSDEGEIVKITKKQVNDLGEVKSLVVTADGMTFTFSKALLKGLLSDGGSYVAIKIKKIYQEDLNAAQQKAIESTVAKLVFTAEIYVNGEYVGDKLNDKKVQVLITSSSIDSANTPSLDGYSLVYISDEGKLKIIASAKEGAKEIEAELPHFSEYAVIKTTEANEIIASQNAPAPKPTVKPTVKPTEKPASPGIKVEYEGGNSFSTSKSAVPTSVEIDGVPVSFIGDGKYFTVGCIDPDAQWVTVRWNSTSVTTNFTPDVTVACPSLGIPKTGDMPVWAAIAAFFGF